MPFILAVFCVLLYFWFAYFLERTEFIKLIVLYSALFFLFYKLVQLLKNHIVILTWCAFVFRAVFILALPNLSQDFYRFIWDGRMVLQGFNPYLFTVESFIKNNPLSIAQAHELYRGMGSLNAGHFSNYPPINQLCFTIAALFAGKSILGSVVVMRLLIIAADFGTLYFGKKLLKALNLPVYTVFWYLLNPFIIIELTGNLHFEGVMIFFLIGSLYLLHSGKWTIAAVLLSCSISVKLIPLLFLPLFYGWFLKRNIIASEPNKNVSAGEIASSLRLHNNGFKNIKKLIFFYLIIGGTTLLLFAPFYSEAFLRNYSNTVALWFQDFEFNASLYYVARSIGYLFRGYNEIGIIGKAIPVLVVVFVGIVSLFRKNDTTLTFISAMLLVLTFYYFMATTVHPWYVATLLMLSVFTNYQYPLVWSFAIILSYAAYSSSYNSENLWLVGLEYAVVFSVFFWEAFIKKKTMKVNPYLFKLFFENRFG
ncbi:MAG TPA: mannosyltransferase, partial [Mariniflexile sp.]|nr:mannosyltransferase [Mariniflexile sp.]